VYRGLKSAAYPPAPERRLSGMKDSCLDWVSTCVFLVDEEVVNALARAVAQLSLQLADAVPDDDDHVSKRPIVRHVVESTRCAAVLAQ
jgi:hypothetical protein